MQSQPTFNTFHYHSVHFVSSKHTNLFGFLASQDAFTPWVFGPFSNDVWIYVFDFPLTLIIKYIISHLLELHFLTVTVL